MAGTLWYVRSDSLGVDTTIGTRLAQSFWNTLHERLDEPAAIALVNRGVFLTLPTRPCSMPCSSWPRAGHACS